MTRSTISEKMKSKFENCADGWENDADFRRCMQEHSRANDTVHSWDHVASGPRKTHNMTPQQRQAQIWEPVVCCINHLWKIQHDTDASTS